MTTPNRSRKSSIVSHRSRAPASLRIPSNPRRAASNAQLSLVFAQGDQTRSNELCEPSLSRQLDGDLGGRQMGLRSRRSSSATVRTVRTASGLRSPSPSHASVMEEDEEGGEVFRGRLVDSPGAGPSSPPSNGQPIAIHPDASKESLNGISATDKRLNPKSSTSWLRWTSPAPSFPRSPSAHRKDKGKGKERADGESAPTQSRPRADPGPTSTIDQTSPVVSTPTPPFTTVSIDGGSSQGPDPPDSSTSAATTPQVTVPASTLSKSRSWWGKAATTQSAPVPTPPPPPIQPIDPLPETTSKAISTTTPPEVSPNVPQTSSPEQAVEQVNQPSLSDPPIETVNANGGTVRGWKGYLGLGGDRVASIQPIPTNTDNQLKAETDAAAPVVLSDTVPAASDISAKEPSNPAEPSEATTIITAPSITKSPDQSNTWTSYFYSFVVPEPRQQSESTMVKQDNIVEPTDPAADQKPVPVPVEAPKPVTEQILTPPSSVPVAAANSTSSRTASPTRDSSRRPSTTGWLNYLAFRASQKKIAAGSIDTALTDGGRSSEPVGEEVMDFSTDPDFPAPQPTHGLAPPARTRGKEVRVDSESIRSVTPKASQNLEIRKKRLSNASTISGSSLTPFPPSPKARSSLDNPQGPTSVKSSSSALPPPAQPNTIQSNRVLPTFATTFDRPPRSFLPPPPAVEAVDTTGGGITATTTGLAWKALGAVGSYVYGDSTPKPTPESILEDEKETRGRKEGRKVGAELPRRIGLGIGTPDDGWKQVRRVVVVGVHGWFPAKMLNSVIGEPTGTSLKFANMMGQAVKQFFDDKGVEDIRLTLMPLEGEGTIDSRVDRLYKAYLSNPAWINDLRRADAIFFAAHSQGCIVTTHLISRLIAQGHIRTGLNEEAVARCEWAFGPIGVVPETKRGRRNISTSITGAEGGRQKVCMLAMCGVHLGPLYSISTSTVIQPYLQWFENAAARELFEFQDTTSAVSEAYQRALSMVLENEVKVVLLASLNDQVVPIYGASFSTATHPLLLRALYVDGASYTQSDFMTNLLCFAFMLRNAGIDDQGLVEHLSEATAGSLTGVGHSTPYEEISCYTIAVQYLFNAGAARHPVTPLQVEPFAAREPKNEFELPYIMRALVDSPEVKDLFPGELKDLKEGILHWRPTTKVLKEIKKRLEPMAGRKSRLRPLTQSPSSTSLASTSDQLGTSPGMNRALASE
nr:uncharacterized protein CI109_006280 [Kwoniella shandongensis]KAA5525381.1 hypothetical protein CI109_006280 [Kwoniella shandongensis]